MSANHERNQEIERLAAEFRENAKKPAERQLQVMVNPQNKLIQIVMLANGHPIPMAQCVLTVEQAMGHIAGVQESINFIRQASGKLVIPLGAGGKPFQT